MRYDGPATPPGLDRSLTYPSIGGGMNWGGVSLDPERDIMIVNTLYYGTIVQLVPRAETDRILNDAKSSSHSVTNFALPLPMKGTPYGARLTGLMSPLDAMCNKPPYGMLSAVDLRTNKLLWSRPIGSASDAGPFRIAFAYSNGHADVWGIIDDAQRSHFLRARTRPGAVPEALFRAGVATAARRVWLNARTGRR